MLQLLVILFATVVLFVAVIWFLTAKGYGFFKPKNNLEYVVLRGEILDHTIRDNIDYSAEKKTVKKTAADGTITPEEIMVITEKPSPSWLYQRFGIRYFGFPFFYKLGEVIVNYPPQFLSTSGLPHTTTNDVAPGLTVHRNYLVWLKDVDFQGGVSFDLKFNAEVVLKRGFVAWGRNGKFLDPLAQCIEGAVKGWALAVNATEFIGKTESGLVDAQTAKETSERLRRELRDSILAINKDTNMGGGGGDPVLLESLCGYEIISVSYNDIQPSNDESKLRLKVLEQQNEAILKTIIAEQDVKTAKAEAEAAAAKLTGPGMAKVAIEKAAGLADAEVMRAKKEAVGAELMVTEFNATALRDTKVTTLVLGGGGVPSVILPLPSTSSPKPDAATPTANPSPAPATGK